MKPLKALIAEDEPLLRGELKEALASLWPELVICAEAEDGIGAMRALARHAPDDPVPRHPDAGHVRARRREAGERPLPCRLRHRLRQVRGRRVRARRRRLRDEAVHDSAARDDGRAAEGEGQFDACEPRRLAPQARRSRIAEGTLALDHGVAGQRPTAHHRRRDLLFQVRQQVHDRRHARAGVADPPADQGTRRRARPAVCSGRSIAGRSST